MPKKRKDKFGPYITPTGWWDETPDDEIDEFSAEPSEEGVFFFIERGGEMVGGVDLTLDTVTELYKFLEREIKRLKKYEARFK